MRILTTQVGGARFAWAGAGAGAREVAAQSGALEWVTSSSTRHAQAVTCIQCVCCPQWCPPPPVLPLRDHVRANLAHTGTRRQRRRLCQRLTIRR